MSGGVKPLFLGRLSRVLFGLISLSWAAQLWGGGPAALAGSLLLVFLGISFLVGGLTANPGCEITALPNLLLPPHKRLHTF